LIIKDYSSIENQLNIKDQLSIKGQLDIEYQLNINEQSDMKDQSNIKNNSNIEEIANKVEPLICATVKRQTQEELSKKLEEFRLKSRSTKASFVDRPRAKSEEAMIKFSGDLSTLFQPRCRLQSESGSPRRHTTQRTGR
jgi:hypothetical protein